MQFEEQLRRAEQRYDELTERLQDGSIAADGPAEEILSDKELLERCGLELPLSKSRL